MALFGTGNEAPPQVYCEEIRDLLVERGGERLEVRQGDRGNYVPNLTTVPVAHPEQVP